MLRSISIYQFKSTAGSEQDLQVYYQTFGPVLGTAPVVLINHSLTGTSEVCGEKGWWKQLVGPGKCVDTEQITVLAINIPGNGACGNKSDLLPNYQEFILRDMARIFSLVLQELGVTKLFGCIGGSIGGALAWELAALQPKLIEHLVVVAADFKTTDWVLGQCRIQDRILSSSADPVQDARMHAMTFYRTPDSFSQKFQRKRNQANAEYEVYNWLSYHGKKLESRFPLAAYKLMNHLLTTIDISRGTGNFEEVVSGIQSDIHVVAIDTDLFFSAEENRRDHQWLSRIKKNIRYSELRSIHGHDAFLIEHEQLSEILRTTFKQNQYNNETSKRSALWNG